MLKLISDILLKLILVHETHSGTHRFSGVFSPEVGNQQNKVKPKYTAWQDNINKAPISLPLVINEF